MKLNVKQLPEIVTSSVERMCYQNVILVVKREVKLDVPEIKTGQDEFHTLPFHTYKTV